LDAERVSGGEKTKFVVESLPGDCRDATAAADDEAPRACGEEKRKRRC
jgi:hypothetical protein